MPTVCRRSRAVVVRRQRKVSTPGFPLKRPLIDHRIERCSEHTLQTRRTCDALRALQHIVRDPDGELASWCRAPESTPQGTNKPAPSAPKAAAGGARFRDSERDRSDENQPARMLQESSPLSRKAAQTSKAHQTWPRECRWRTGSHPVDQLLARTRRAYSSRSAWRAVHGPGSMCSREPGTAKAREELNPPVPLRIQEMLTTIASSSSRFPSSTLSSTISTTSLSTSTGQTSMTTTTPPSHSLSKLDTAAPSSSSPGPTIQAL